MYASKTLRAVPATYEACFESSMPFNHGAWKSVLVHFNPTRIVHVPIHETLGPQSTYVEKLYGQRTSYTSTSSDKKSCITHAIHITLPEFLWALVYIRSCRVSIINSWTLWARVAQVSTCCSRAQEWPVALHILEEIATSKSAASPARFALCGKAPKTTSLVLGLVSRMHGLWGPYL